MKKSTNAKESKKVKAGSSKRNTVNPDKILDAAMELMSEFGYAGTSISRICEKSGFPATSIYWHFGSKERLLTAAIERSFVRWLDALPDAEKVKGPLIDRLDKLAVLDASHFEDQMEFLRLMLIAGLERRSADPEIMKMVGRIRTHAREFLISRIVGFTKSCGIEISIEKTESLAKFWMACSDGAFIASQVEPDETSVQEILIMSGRVIVALIEGEKDAGKTLASGGTESNVTPLKTAAVRGKKA